MHYYFDLKVVLTEQIRRYINQERLGLEHRGDTGAALNLNSCVLLVGIGNLGAETVSRIMRQIEMIGISSDSYTGLALVDSDFPERDDQIEYIVIEKCSLPRNRVQETLLEKKDAIAAGFEALNTRIMKVMERTGANIKIYVVSNISEDLFACCPIVLSLLENSLNNFFVANTGIEFIGLFCQSAMLKTKQEHAKVFAAWQEIEAMSSPDFKVEIDMGDLLGLRANRIFREKPIFSISYLYSDFNENSSPILETVDGDFSVAEMLATLIYLRSSSQFNEAIIFNSLQMPSPVVAGGLPRYATVGYSKKSIKISAIFSYTCWYLLNKTINANKSKAGYISQDWESVLNELEINNFGIEGLGAEVYSSVQESLKEIEELQLEKEVVKNLLTQTLDSAEKELMGGNAKLIFEERIVKAAKQITQEYLPKQLESFAKTLGSYLQNQRRGLFFVKRLLKSDEAYNKKSLIKHLEEKINELRTKSDALRLKADRASQLALARLDIEPDKKGLLGFGNKKTNFIKRLIEVKYGLLQEAVVNDQLCEILRAYLTHTRELYTRILKQEENILSLEKALNDIRIADRKKLVAVGEDGLIDLYKDRFDENKKEEMANELFATVFRDNDLSIYEENGIFYHAVVKALFDSTRHLLSQTNIRALSLERLLESLTQTQPAKGKQMVEDLYAKCNLALCLNKGVMSRQPETHYYFFNNGGNSSLRSYIKGLFQGKPYDVLFVDYNSIKSIRMVKACFGFELKDIYFYRNYEEAYEMFATEI